MKISTAFKRAYAAIENGQQEFACVAVNHFGGRAAENMFKEYFMPRKFNAFIPRTWIFDLEDGFTGFDYIDPDEAKARRLTALGLAIAIAESEGL